MEDTDKIYPTAENWKSFIVAPPKYRCEYHGEVDNVLKFWDSKDNTETAFCTKCLELKLLQLGLKQLTYA